MKLANYRVRHSILETRVFWRINIFFHAEVEPEDSFKTKFEELLFKNG